ncbi:MAG: hypothetical protein V3R49_02250 [Gammaproteobacteria bacterium]
MRKSNIMVVWGYVINMAVVIFILLMMIACKKEEELKVPSSTNNNSTRLIDGHAPVGASFTNFKSETFSIDPSQLPISGTRVFLKLTKPSGKVLFLGEIDRYRYFSINIDLRLDDEKLNYEIFTNDSSDETKFGTISL